MGLHTRKGMIRMATKIVVILTKRLGQQANNLSRWTFAGDY